MLGMGSGATFLIVNFATSVVSAGWLQRELHGSYNSVATVKVNFEGIIKSCTLNT
jgi:hypothetical protein